MFHEFQCQPSRVYQLVFNLLNRINVMHFKNASLFFFFVPPTKYLTCLTFCHNNMSWMRGDMLGKVTKTLNRSYWKCWLCKIDPVGIKGAAGAPTAEMFQCPEVSLR